MQYTLDSVEHAVAVLREKHKGQTVTYDPIFISDLRKLNADEVSATAWFFGVLTNGFADLQLMNDENQSIITVGKNSQIIELFKHLVVDPNQVFNGHFRGFQISII